MLVPITFALLQEASAHLTTPETAEALEQAAEDEVTWSQVTSDGRTRIHAPGCETLRRGEAESEPLEGALAELWDSRCPQCPDPLRDELGDEDVNALRKAAILLAATRLPETACLVAAHRYLTEALGGTAASSPHLFTEELLAHVQGTKEAVEAELAQDPEKHLDRYAATEVVGNVRRAANPPAPESLQGVRGLRRGLLSAWRREKELGTPGAATASLAGRTNPDPDVEAYARELYAALDAEHEALRRDPARHLVALPGWTTGGGAVVNALLRAALRGGTSALEVPPASAQYLQDVLYAADFGPLEESDTAAVKETALALHKEGNGELADPVNALQAARLV